MSTMKLEITENCRPPRPERRTHCKNKHELTPENTYRPRGRGRQCKRCRQISTRKSARNRRQEREPLFLKWTPMSG